MADIKKIQVCLRHITSQHCSKGHLSQKTSERWKSCVGQQPPAIKSVVFNVLPFALIACLVLNRTSRMVCTSNKVSTNAKEQRPQENIIISMCACLLVREHACKTTCPKLQAHLQHRLGRNPGIAQLISTLCLKRVGRPQNTFMFFFQETTWALRTYRSLWTCASTDFVPSQGLCPDICSTLKRFNSLPLKGFPLICSFASC